MSEYSYDTICNEINRIQAALDCMHLGEAQRAYMEDMLQWWKEEQEEVLNEQA